MSLLKIKDLNKTYENINALSDVNITIEGGKIVGLLGKNGAGKSTLIKIINGLLQKDSGEILLNGKKITFKEKDAIAYLPERSYLNKNMRVIDYFNYMEDFYESFNRDKAIKLLDSLKLNINMKISKMSKGMQEKLQLILVMARDAELYILDEPLGGVDPATRDYILDTILTNFKELDDKIPLILEELKKRKITNEQNNNKIEIFQGYNDLITLLKRCFVCKPKVKLLKLNPLNSTPDSALIPKNGLG